MESFERSKYLPLSIALAVVPKTREVLGFRLASMPANTDGEKTIGLKRPAILFSELAPVLSPLH